MSERQMYVKICKKNRILKTAGKICKGTAFVAFFCVAIAVSGRDDYNAEHGYVVKKGVVSETTFDTQTITTKDGNIWVVENTDMEVGDKVNLTIDTNRTGSDISDDIVVRVEHRIF